MLEAKLSLRGVTKSFGNQAVLRGIDLDVAEGEMICLIGASGSGKSTLLRCINQLEPVDDGNVWLDGLDISEPGLDLGPMGGAYWYCLSVFQLISTYDCYR